MKFTLRNSARNRFRAAATAAALVAGGTVVLTGASPALAAGGTGSQLFGCTNLQSADANDHTAPIKVSVAVDSTWPTSASPAGQAIPLTATVTLGIPSEVVYGLRHSGLASQLGITGSRLHVHLTNATPSDVILNVGTAARVALPADNSGPLNFTFNNVSLGTIMTAGTNGGTVTASISTSATDDGFGLNPNGLAGPGQADFGYLQVGGANAPHGNCVPDADATANSKGGTPLHDYTVADNSPTIASITLAGATPPTTSPTTVKVTGTAKATKRVISGKLTAASKGVSGLKVTVKIKVKSSWKTVVTLKTNASGAYKTGKLKKAGTYEVVSAKQTIGTKIYTAWTSKAVKVK
jgi:hypothetical protein